MLKVLDYSEGKNAKMNEGSNFEDYLIYSNFEINFIYFLCRHSKALQIQFLIRILFLKISIN